MDSTGQTIDFLLAAKRDTAAAKRFFEKVFSSSSNPIPRVINVDKNPAYPAAVEALKVEGTLLRRVLLRQCKYLNMDSLPYQPVPELRNEPKNQFFVPERFSV